MNSLLTAQQVSERFGIPKARTVRTLRLQGLPAVKIGKQFLYDPADVEAFIERVKQAV